MQIIPPRLNHLLHILLRSREPVAVQALGVELGVSRRTVFRELENIDALLKPYGQRIGTITGIGILLEGSDEGRTKLHIELKNAGRIEPAGRQERKLHLTLLLLQARGPQKLFYYANALGVSEATISNDLDRMESWLGEYRLKLVRKQSFGIHVEGCESAVRRACIAVLQAQRDEGLQWSSFPGKLAIDGLRALSGDLDRLCLWMTPESREALELYLLVAVKRMLDNRIVETQSGNDQYRDMAAELAALLGKQLGHDLPEQEIHALTVELLACRNNTTVITAQDTGRDYHLLRLAYQMIEAFDPSMASILKLDEDLLNGLVLHLRSALVRLENHIELRDPLLTQIAENYPDLLMKSAQAAQVLVGESGWMTQSEVGFLATHFGAAVHRLEERGIRKRILQIGVVCLNGIGTSYILAAQVKKHFETECRIEVSGWENPEEWMRYDLIISTVPLKDAKIPVITVSPFLDEGSLHRIRAEIGRLAFAKQQDTPKRDKGSSLAAGCSSLKELCTDVQALLENFDTVSIEADCAFERLIKLVGYRFGDGEENGRLIYEGLAQRENLSSQVIPEIGLVLLHCRTDGVTSPVFALISPQGERFSHPCFKNTRACVLLLMPQRASRERTELMGCVSSALVEYESFLSSVLQRDREQVLAHLEDILKNYLVNYINKNWRG